MEIQEIVVQYNEGYYDEDGYWIEGRGSVAETAEVVAHAEGEATYENMWQFKNE